MLDVDLFTRVIDEAGPSLGRVDFFNYGEAFLHKRAVEMCEYMKAAFPHVYLYTSTNGLAFNEESARRLARSGIDEVTFSIDGASQETLRALPPARALRRRRRQPARDGGREAQGRPRRARHQLALHPLHVERQRRARCSARGTMAAEIGVDRLTWEITDHPEDAFSRRFVPGSPDYERIRHEIWDTNNLGNAIPGAMPRARIDVPGLLPGLPLVARRGGTLNVKTRVHNLSARPFPREASYGRRLVRLGAQLCDADGTVVDRDYARAWLPHTIDGGGQADVPIEIPAPAEPGRYQLKFDLVSEGIDWFEACGSRDDDEAAAGLVGSPAARFGRRAT